MKRVSKLLLFAPATCLLALVTMAIALLPTLAVWLQFDALAIANGGYWRVLSGHLVHWNFDHLCWDLFAFVALGTLCERRSRAAFLACVIASAMAISWWLFVMMPEMPIYRGLSGVGSGLFALFAVGLWIDAWSQRDRLTLALVVLAACGLIGKTVYESATGATLFVDHAAAEFVPVTASHVIGAAVGLLIGVVSPLCSAPIAHKRHAIWRECSETKSRYA